MALSAGNDLAELDVPAAERHLAVCPRCRGAWERLKQSQQALERVSAPLERGKPASLWPGVARHIRVIDEQVVAPNWRSWLPAGALAAACLAVVLVAIPDVGAPNNGSSAVIISHPAAYGIDPRDLRRIPLGFRPDAERVVPEGARGDRRLPGNDNQDARSF